jgi:hypothetical protein
MPVEDEQALAGECRQRCGGFWPICAVVQLIRTLPDSQNKLSLSRRKYMTKQKSADDYTREEILEWIGAGPKRQGIWNLTHEQAKAFKPGEHGIIHAHFRYTKWHISENGAIRWEEASKREFEEAKRSQEEKIHRAIDAIFALPPEPEFQIGDHFRIQASAIEERVHYQELGISPDAIYMVEQWFNHKAPLSADDPHGHPDFDQEDMNCSYTAQGLPILIHEWEMIPEERENDQT